MSTCDLPFGGSKAEMIRGIKEKTTPKLAEAYRCFDNLLERHL